MASSCSWRRTTSGTSVLTNLLLPSIVDRVVTVSSGAHRMGRIVLDDLNWQRRRYHPWGAYGQSKLANLLFTLELERRLTAAGSTVHALAAHPGYTATNLQSHSANPVHVGADVDRQPRRRAARRPRRVADAVSPRRKTCLAPATSGPTASRRLRGHPTLVARSSSAADPDLAAALWSSVGADDRHHLPASDLR